MIAIPDHAIAREDAAAGISIPGAIDFICPFCQRKVTFGMSWSVNPKAPLLYTTSRCPGCGQHPTFMLVGVNDNTPRRGKLFMYPAPPTRGALTGIEEGVGLQNPLLSAYHSAVNCYNVREWAATAISCRRVLEGLTKGLLPDSKHGLPLARAIEALPQYTKLDEPVLALARALKQGGNLGAHFDLEREPNEEMARLMMDLLDDLIEYLFILPKRIAELESKVH